MNFPSAVVSCLRNYVNFSGRATRSEFWYWTLAYILLVLPLSVADEVMNRGTIGKLSYVVGALTLVLFLPNLAVAVRRLHDTDRSGWWLLLSFTVIGAPVVLYWYCCRSTDGRNRFDTAAPVIAIAKPRYKVAAIHAAQPA